MWFSFHFPQQIKNYRLISLKYKLSFTYLHKKSLGRTWSKCYYSVYPHHENLNKYAEVKDFHLFLLVSTLVQITSKGIFRISNSQSFLQHPNTTPIPLVLTMHFKDKSHGKRALLNKEGYIRAAEHRKSFKTTPKYAGLLIPLSKDQIISK